MRYNKKKAKYNYAILGNKGNGRTTLYNAIKNNNEMLEGYQKIYPEVLTREMSIVRLWSIVPEIETVVLVFSAENGLTPEIREYTLLSKQLGFEKIMVYISKADLVDKEELEIMKKEIRDIIINDYQYDESCVEVVSGSAYETLLDNPFDLAVQKSNKRVTKRHKKENCYEDE